MKICKTINELLDCVATERANGKSVGLLPTMGSLHEGHLSLLQRAKQENDVVVCSIFVNPIQFNNNDDFESYPRDFELDQQLLEANDCDIAFIPSAEEVYAEPAQEQYSFGALEEVMEGAARPGHFNGVATIVKRLFDWSKADRAYFGEKDIQQIAIIKDLVRQFDIAIEVVVCPIHRDEDGLATSSRNKRLSEQKRMVAPKIHQILSKSYFLKDSLSLSQIKNFVISEFKMYKDFELEYFEVVDAKTLQPIIKQGDNGAIGCIAVWLDGVRLIDNQRYY